MIGELINQIIEKYYRDEEDYYSSCRYDEENHMVGMKDEIKEVLTEKGATFQIEFEDGFDSCGYGNDFLAIAYIETDGSLGLKTALLETM